MKEVGLTAPRTRFLGPDGLLEEELLKGATCDAAMATEMRVTFAGLPFEKMRGVGAKMRVESTAQRRKSAVV